jgi:hypothetical protein
MNGGEVGAGLSVELFMWDDLIGKAFEECYITLGKGIKLLTRALSLRMPGSSQIKPSQGARPST